MSRFRCTCTADPRDVISVREEFGKDLLGELLAALKNADLSAEEGTDSRGFNSFSFVVSSDVFPNLSALKKATDGVCKELNVREVHFTVVPEEGTEGSRPLGETDIQEAVASILEHEEPAASSGMSAYDEILSLVGSEEIKAWAEKVNALPDGAEGRRARESALSGMSYLLSVDPGNGCTVVLEKMGRLIAEKLGRQECVVKEVRPAYRPEDEDGQPRQSKDPLAQIESEVSRWMPSQKLTVYAIHLDEYMQRLHTERVTDFLRALRKADSSIIFFFVVPLLEDRRLKAILSDLEDTTACRILRIRPFGDKELICFFERFFSENGLTVDPESVNPLLRKVAEEKRDGRFYGASTVRKICDEILYEKMLGRRFGSSVTPEDVFAVLPEAEHDDGVSGWELLDRLVALQTVKDKVRELCTTIRWEKANAAGRPRSMHMMFSGPPGTGKTAVARIIGRFLKEEGVLSRGAFYEVSRKDLVGKYVGHTAPKTAAVCRNAYGSVLFIDEAYALASGTDRDFGPEAVSTLIAEMENNRDRLLVIFAGYEKELQQLFELNPGLRDRVPYHIQFPPYSRDELLKIFFTMIPEGFHCEDEFKRKAESYFLNLSDEVMNSPNFSNARFVRNVVERVISKATLRLYDSKEDERILLATDFQMAVADAEFSDLMQEKRPKTIGFF